MEFKFGKYANGSYTGQDVTIEAETEGAALMKMAEKAAEGALGKNAKIRGTMVESNGEQYQLKRDLLG